MQQHTLFAFQVRLPVDFIMDLFHLEEALTGELRLVLRNDLPSCTHVQLLYGFLLPAPFIFDMDQADEITVGKVCSYVAAVIRGNSSGNMVFRAFLEVQRTSCR